jgi:HPt (histidine-containing phosphotransfer) domain-containing protein
VTAGRSTPTPTPTPAPARTDAPEQSDGLLIDKGTLLTACDGDEALLKEMIKVFQSEAASQLAAVEAAIRQQDSPQLRETAHKLKGLVSAFSSSTAATMEQLEQLGADGRCADAAAPFSVAARQVRSLLSTLPGLTLDQLRD